MGMTADGDLGMNQCISNYQWYSKNKIGGKGIKQLELDCQNKLVI